MLISNARMASHLLALLFLLLVVTPAFGSLIDNGNFTTDTDSGLDWYDIDLTLKGTLAEITAEFEVGGSLEGYKLATTAEFITFMANAGLTAQTNGPFGLSAGAVDAANALLALTGTTYWSASEIQAIGRTADTHATDAEANDYAAIELYPLTPGARAWVSGNSLNYCPETFSCHSWVNRISSVPEPTTASLLALGLVGMASARRRTAARTH